VPLHAQQQYAYVAEAAAIEGWAINPTTGALLSTGAPTVDTNGPVAVAATGSYVFVANGNASVSAFLINGSNGILTEIAGSPFHSPDGLSPTAILTDGNFVYLVNGGQPTNSDVGIVDSFSIGSSGALTFLSSASAPGQAVGAVLTPNGNFLFVYGGVTATLQGYSLSAGAATPIGSGLTDGQMAGVMTGNASFLFAAHDNGLLDSVSIGSGGVLSLVDTYDNSGQTISDLALDSSGATLYTNQGVFAVSGGTLSAVVPTPLSPSTPVALLADSSAEFLFVGGLASLQPPLIYPLRVATDGQLTNSEPPRVLAAVPISFAIASTSTVPVPSADLVTDPSGPVVYSPICCGNGDLLQISVYSTGSLPLTLDNFVISGDTVDFSIVSSTCGNSLPSEQLCFLYVSFLPLASGNHTATLTITDNAGDSPQTIALSGLGTPPPPNFLVTLISSPAAGGAIQIQPINPVTPDTYPKGSSISLQAIPAAGWSFQQWSSESGGNECVGATSILCGFLLDSNETVVAVFVQSTDPPPTSASLSVSAAQTIAAGATATYTITATGFSSSPKISISSCPTGAGITCSMSGATLSISTTKASTTQAVRETRLRKDWTPILSLVFLSLIILASKKQRRLALCLGALSLCAACGSSTRSLTVTPVLPTSAGTPSGVYTVAITGLSGAQTATANAQLTVN
jgi:hypothetical protein